MSRVARLVVGPATVSLVQRGAVTDERPHAGDPAATAGQMMTGAIRRIVVVLAPPFAQARRLSKMPPVASDQLAAIVAQQPHRYLRPMAGGPLVTAAHWQDDPAGRQAAIVAAPEAFLTTLHETLRSSGAHVVRTTVAGFEDTAIDLVPPAARGARERADLRQLVFAVAFTVVCWFVYGAWRAASLANEVDRLDRSLASAETAVASVRRARVEVEQVETALRVVDSLRAARASVITTLMAVVEVLPRDAYLIGLGLTEDSVSLTGAARSPAAVVKSLAGRRELRDVRLEAPRGRGPASGVSPFDISAIRAQVP